MGLSMVAAPALFIGSFIMLIISSITSINILVQVLGVGFTDEFAFGLTVSFEVGLDSQILS